MRTTRRCAMGMSPARDTHGTSMGHPWDIHGTSMGNPWDTHLARRPDSQPSICLGESRVVVCSAQTPGARTLGRPMPQREEPFMAFQTACSLADLPTDTMRAVTIANTAV